MPHALPIATAPHDGSWFKAIGPNGLCCRAHFLTIVGPSHRPIEILVSEFGGQIEVTHWQPINE
ncbi:hypothetical protein E8E01_11760 [Methylorubrum populi]|uniref:hypothetical protein n=1 Tax=Methylorubrum populi TaxID=223967 RepID=UPI001153E629|nr:hypothetical protein [Methylorubrum populi]QDI81063.1 hypothetical protein E8E01_11760 [Methylorubrum populi]